VPSPEVVPAPPPEEEPMTPGDAPPDSS